MAEGKLDIGGTLLRVAAPVGLLGALALGALTFWPKSAPAPTEPLPDRLGVAERYGLSDAEIASLAPDALVKKALLQSTVAQLDAAAADDDLSLGLLCLSQYYGEGAARDVQAAAVTCARGAERNAPGAGYALAMMTRAGEGGLTADPLAADAVLRKASDAGDARAQAEVAQSLRALNAKEARALAEICAARGHLGCRFIHAQMLASGEGGAKDLPAAIAAYEAMAAEYYAPAMRELGKLQMDANAEQAALQFKRAAILDDGEASFLLGQLAERGQGVPQSNADALTYYREAQADGYAPAAEAVARLSTP
jgi:TPR repeat protein